MELQTEIFNSLCFDLWASWHAETSISPLSLLLHLMAVSVYFWTLLKLVAQSLWPVGP